MFYFTGAVAPVTEILKYGLKYGSTQKEVVDVI
jgi:hypothetical protein